MKMTYYPDFSNLAQLIFIHRTFKKCNKKVGSPSLFSLCIPFVLSAFTEFREKHSKLDQPGRKILVTVAKATEDYR